MRHHFSAPPAHQWLLALCFSLALSLQPVRAVPFSVNLLGDYQGKVKDADELPPTYADTQLLYGIEQSGGSPAGWQETGDASLFKTTFAVDNVIAGLQLTSNQRPELSYLALQAGDDYAVWDIRGWNSWESDSLLVFNDRITTTHTIRVPFFGSLRITVPEDITGIALYGPLIVESHGSDGEGDSGGGSGSGDGNWGGGIVLGGDAGSHPTRVPDGGSVVALLAVGVAAAAFMTRRAS